METILKAKLATIQRKTLLLAIAATVLVALVAAVAVTFALGSDVVVDAARSWAKAPAVGARSWARSWA